VRTIRLRVLKLYILENEGSVKTLYNECLSLHRRVEGRGGGEDGEEREEARFEGTTRAGWMLRYCRSTKSKQALI
jgi:hypothetical protein